MSKGKTRALLNYLVKFTDLFLKILNNLAGFFLLLPSLLDESPALLDLFSEDSDSACIILGQLDSTFDLNSVLKDGVVQVLTPPDESFL